MAVEGRKEAKEMKRMEDEEYRILKMKSKNTKKAKNEPKEAGHLNKSSLDICSKEPN